MNPSPLQGFHFRRDLTFYVVGDFRTVNKCCSHMFLNQPSPSGRGTARSARVRAIELRLVQSEPSPARLSAGRPLPKGEGCAKSKLHHTLGPMSSVLALVLVLAVTPFESAIEQAFSALQNNDPAAV